MIYLNILIVALIAFALSMVCGGGAGLLLIPILGYALPAAQVPAALSIGTAVSSGHQAIYILWAHPLENGALLLALRLNRGGHWCMATDVSRSNVH